MTRQEKLNTSQEKMVVTWIAFPASQGDSIGSAPRTITQREGRTSIAKASDFAGTFINLDSHVKSSFFLMLASVHLKINIL